MPPDPAPEVTLKQGPLAFQCTSAIPSLFLCLYQKIEQLMISRSAKAPNNAHLVSSYDFLKLCILYQISRKTTVLLSKDHIADAHFLPKAHRSK
jgi:hypothetical protein